MTKEELIKRAKNLDLETERKQKEEEKTQTLLQKAQALKVIRKDFSRRQFTEQDLELVEAYLQGKLTGRQIVRVIHPDGVFGSHYFSYISQVLKHFYEEGRVTIK